MSKLIAVVVALFVAVVLAPNAYALATRPPGSPPAKAKAQRVMVALVLGQSNAANYGESRRLAGPKVFNLRDGLMTRAKDPLRGANGVGGSVWTRLGDALIASGLYDRVIFIPAAIGGTEIGQWAPDMPLNKLIQSAIDDAAKRGLPITHILWHQGESDAYLKIGYADYQLRFRNILKSIRERGVGAPIFVSVATRCADSGPNEEIQGAQANLVNHEAGIWAGPNTDTLDGNFRRDGCHFSDKGLAKASELWLDAIKAYELRSPK